MNIFYYKTIPGRPLPDLFIRRAVTVTDPGLQLSTMATEYM